MKPNRFLVSIALLWLISCGNQPPPPAEGSGRSVTPTGLVTFLTAEGDSVTTLRIAIAQTEQDVATGLMDVRSMPHDVGMLFIFEDIQPRSFWMANTPLSLDMFFIDSENRIRRIHANTTPLSHTSYASDDPVKYVIETNAGYSLQHDITEGHLIRIHD